MTKNFQKRLIKHATVWQAETPQRILISAGHLRRAFYKFLNYKNYDCKNQF